MRVSGDDLSRTVGVTLFALLLLLPPTGQSNASTQEEVALFIRDNILEGSLEGVTLWMTDTPYDQSHVARDRVLEAPDVPLPYESTWVVMIDYHPEANWGHFCSWVFVNDSLSVIEYEIQDESFPPIVLAENGEGSIRPFACVDLTDLGAGECPNYFHPSTPVIDPAPDNTCLHAVLISGGVSEAENHNTYYKNIDRMFKILRHCGFPKSNIFVYFADGRNFDLDDEDADGQHSTGSDVIAANKSAIRGKIQDLCGVSTSEDVLFIYTTNHGADNLGLTLWDFDGRGLGYDEVYTPTELGSDTSPCWAGRLYMILDQCFSGEFLSIATDGNHRNSAIYVATNDRESSWDSEYLDAWDNNGNNDPSIMTMNDMHPTTLPRSTPGSGDVPFLVES